MSRFHRHAPLPLTALLILVLLSHALLPDVSTAQDGDEVVRVETDLTNILFTAIDRDKRFITSLRREDVRVFENDAPQEIFTFQRETDLPLSVAILIDVSRSQAEPLPNEKAAALAFVKSVLRPDKDNAAVVSFTGKQKIQQPLTNDVAALKSSIERLEVKVPPAKKLTGRVAYPQAENAPAVDDEDDAIYSTAIWDALFFTADKILAHTPERTRRAIILLSDGDDTSSDLKKSEAVERAIKSNVTIYSIGIGSSDWGIKKKTLREVSEKTGGGAFFPEDKTALGNAFAQIEQELRSQYLLAYTPSNNLRDGSYRRIRLEIINPDLRKQKLRLLYRQGYYAQAVK